jgi:hypothetical protein
MKTKSNSRSLYMLAFMMILIVLVCLLPNIVSAQVGPPCVNPDDPGCPIDGGLSVLLAAGVGYGVKKYRESRKPVADKMEV